MPVPEFVDEFIAATAGNDKKMNQGLIPPLIDYILEARGLNARGWAVTPDAFRPDALPPHFSMNYKLIDEHGRQLDMNRSLVALRGEWGKEAKEEFAELHETPSEYTQLTDWTFGELPELMEVPVGKRTVLGYPALVDDGETVSLKVFDSAEEAAETHRRGLARLFMLQFKEQVKYFDKNVPGMSQMGMQFMALGTTEELKRQIVNLTFERACLTEPLPTTPEAFKARCGEAKARLGLIMQEVCRLVGTVLTEWQAVTKKLPAFKAQAAVVADIEAQLKRLVGKNFVGRHAVRAPAALSALPEGGWCPARQAQSSPGTRRPSDGRLRQAMDQLRAPGAATGQDGGGRSAGRAVPLAAGGVARRPLRAGTADAGAGLGQASGKAMGGYQAWVM